MRAAFREWVHQKGEKSTHFSKCIIFVRYYITSRRSNIFIFFSKNKIKINLARKVPLFGGVNTGRTKESFARKFPFSTTFLPG